MFWKRLKIGLVILLILAILIPIGLYLNAIDLSKTHRKRVDALPVFSNTVQQGEFRLAANGYEFLVRVAGMQNDGEAMILLHGFPESSIMWQPLLDSAAARGYRVLAFDQRGYSPNARPSGAEQYQIDSLVGDVIAIADNVGFDTFHLVGHDWGSGVGWKTTMDYPERIRTWTAMAVPHIGFFFDAVINHPEQRERSAYMKKLQTPLLPEFLFAVGKNSVFERVKDIWKPSEIAEYNALLSEHGALTATLNWYRALDLETSTIDPALLKTIHRPTLYIWGKSDRIITHELVPQQADFIDTTFQTLPLDCGHSLMQEKTDSVLVGILEHLNR